ncbi:amidohydrolase family protein [Sedimentibacter sp.]|uniref:amidohydrolase family protein n=1 Tax=Sedimentibacter sp. TaxID=1960295 RepID=UPI0028A0DF7F|nr:amidohydrolase family protein [Sedimentibacter sp.]
MKKLIKNGFVVDPANKVYSKQNILIDNGKIVFITNEVPKSDVVIDAEDKIVCPGFIDIHMHEEPLNELNNTLEKSITNSMLRMGVTTAIGGNCGINTIEPKKYLDIVDEEGSPISIGLFAGHTFVREMVGNKDKYTNIKEDELRNMQKVLQENLEAGCLGISYGIRYVPGINEEEMLETAKYCKSNNKIITAHVRDDAAYIFEAVNELAKVGIKLNIPVQNSHIGSMAGFGQMEELLSMIDRYKANGLDITNDCYPYYAFSTRIGETTYDGDFLKRYKADYSCIEICEGKYKGQRCNEEIFNELRKLYPKTLTVCHVMKKEDVDLALIHPNVMIASDGLMDGEQGHPRASGTFPRFISQYVKSGKISLFNAIEKMSFMQAEKLGLSAKGRLNVGADADIVIFDINKIQDNATFEKPTAKPNGIEYVLINGEIALKDNEIINNSLGKSIRKY